MTDFHNFFSRHDPGWHFDIKITSSLSSVVQVVTVLFVFFSVTLSVKMTCSENYENWLNFVKVMPKILAVISSFLILTNLYFQIPKVVPQRN